jgi:hypothetical protein
MQDMKFVDVHLTFVYMKFICNTSCALYLFTLSQFLIWIFALKIRQKNVIKFLKIFFCMLCLGFKKFWEHLAYQDLRIESIATLEH